MLPAIRRDLEIEQGDTLVILATVAEDAFGVPVTDATGWHLLVTVKALLTDPDSAALLHAGEGTEDITGNQVAQVLNTETLTPGARLVYDARLIDPAGRAFTYQRGNLFVNAAVTDTLPAQVDPFEAIEGVTPVYGAVRIITTGGSYWFQIQDTVTGWETIWWNNGVFATGGTPGAGIGCRINGGFLELRDAGSLGAAYRAIWWNNGVLEAGPLDNAANPDGNPLTAARLQTVAGSIFLQLADQAHPGMFRALLLTNGAPVAGPLVS
jgi:hypothetical protein